jgi:hypothetical protein
MRKPRTLQVDIEGTFTIGPLGLGYSTIVEAEKRHLASVLVAGTFASPEEARQFQHWLTEVIKAQADAAASKILDPAGMPAKTDLIH